METPSPKHHIAWDCLDKHAESWVNKHKVALIEVSPQGPPKKLTYSQLSALTNRLAHALQGLAMAPAARVIVRLSNDAEFPISFLACLKAGLIPIPCSPLFTWKELEFLLDDSQAEALITSPELCPPEIETVKPDSLRHLILSQGPGLPVPPGTKRWEDLLKEGSSQALAIKALPDDPAYWLYTSGTTGRPKAAVHAHRSIPAHDRRAQLWLDVRGGDVIFNTSALNWSYALTAGCLDMWRHGLTTVIDGGPPEPERLIKIIQTFGVSTLMSVPGIYRRLCRYLKETSQGLPGLRMTLSSGENLSEATQEQWKDLTGLPLRQGLGMTENSIFLVQPHDQEVVPKSVGQSVFGDQIEILSESDLGPLPPGETGILATSRQCPGLMLGYHSREGGLEQPWAEDWFLSGDLASRDEQGNFFFIGRRDDVITAGGYRISPIEVEQTLNQHPDVLESAVVSETRGEATFVVAHVVLSGPDSAPLEPKALQDFLKENLSPYKIPRKFIFTSELPKTVTGKIKRRDLITK